MLALAPALVRRYDATERLVAERALSTARVLARIGGQTHRRRRTVPGKRPVNPPRFIVARMSGGVPVGEPALAVVPDSVSPSGPDDSEESGSVRRTPKRAPMRLRHTPAVYRRRRVFAALLLLNLVELVGVIVVGPGFWISTAVTGTLLVAYMVHLRQRAIVEQRRRREEARYAAWVAARQAAIRREQARRAAARREALRRQLQEREETRRQAVRLAAQSAVRGRAYEARAVGQDW
nr:hypothetical protein [Planosporangium flavigriseum]